MRFGSGSCLGGLYADPSRRSFLRQTAFALALTGAPRGLRARSGTIDELHAMEAELGGRIGLAALDTGNGARVTHRGAERFAMCSTFKWMLAAAVLARHDAGAAVLAQRLSFGPGDLLPHSPVTSEHVAEGSLKIVELCEAAVETSDNTAANTLLDFIGGPSALTHYLRTIGDRTTRLDRVELELNTNLPGDPRDTSTPTAMLATMRTLLVEPAALSASSRQVLLGWLKNCQTGGRRLRAGLPPSWVVGDKTGTGGNGAVNDSAIAWPPGRPPILIAAYLSGSHAPSEALDAAHARLGRLVGGLFN
jgi:beta-lactamase class A